MLFGLTLAFSMMSAIITTEFFDAQILLMWLNLSFPPAFASNLAVWNFNDWKHH